MKPFQKTTLLSCLLIALTACGSDNNDSTESQTPTNPTNPTTPTNPTNPTNPTDPTTPTNPTTPPTVADRVTGSWQNNYCYNGELTTNVGYKTTDNKVRITAEKRIYQNKDCTGDIVNDHDTASNSLVVEMQPTQTISGTNYSFNVVSEKDATFINPNNTTYAFKDANTYCSTSYTDPAKIKDFLDTVTIKNNMYCHTRTTTANSLIPPTTVIDKSQYKFVPATTHADLLTQANTLGAQGYALYKSFIAHKKESNTETSEKSHIFIKLNSSQDTYSYVYSDIDNNIVAEHYLLIAKEREEKAKQGYVLKTIYDLGINKSKLLFVKNLKSTNTYTYGQAFIYSTQSGVDNMLKQLNAAGAEHCKYQYTHATFTNNGSDDSNFEIPICLKTTGDNSTYSYRWIDNKNTAGNYTDNPLLLEQLLKDQAKEGYHLIDAANSLHVYNKSGYLFEKDSADTTANLSYKVQTSSVIVSSDRPSVINDRVQDQANLGWFLLTDKIYSNKPSYYAFGYTGVIAPK